MPLPSLKTHKVADANAVEYQKRVLLGEPRDAAATAVGGPVRELEQHPAAQALARAVEPDELEAIRGNPKAARLALETREGRASWLEGVIAGDVKSESFMGAKEFPAAVRVAALKLRGLMNGDFVNRHEVQVTESVYVFAIPDNGRVPAQHVVDALPEDTE